ncbi:MAG: hypothetical protein WC477_02885 [Patescibacteria group bacterium]
MKKNVLKKIAAGFVASVTVAAFALALAPMAAQAKIVSPFIKIVPGYAAPGYVYRPTVAVAYRPTPFMRIVPGYTAPGYRPKIGYVMTYRPWR